MQFRDGGLESGREVAELLQLVIEQVDDGFGVGVGVEHVAQALEALAQRFVILDDAVVHHGQLMAGEVWVSVTLARCAMSGPARVGDAQAPGQWLGLQGGLQLADLADTAAAIQRTLFGQQRHAGAVITPVLQALEAFDQDRGDIALGDGAYDSTHGALLSFPAARGSAGCRARVSVRQPGHPGARR